MKNVLLISLMIAACSAAKVSFADPSMVEAAQRTTETHFAKIAELGPGVHAIRKDSQGRIVSMLVVGESRISTVLGAAQGKEQARIKADLAASAEFVKWLKEDVSVMESVSDGAVFILEGTEADNDTFKESAKLVEKSNRTMMRVSRGLIRGLRTVYKEIDGKEKTLRIVKGWSAKNVDEATRIAGQNAPRIETTSDIAPSKASPSAASARAIDKSIRDVRSIAADAEEFLP